MKNQEGPILTTIVISQIKKQKVTLKTRKTMQENLNTNTRRVRLAKKTIKKYMPLQRGNLV